MAETHTCEECGKRLATIGGLEIHMALAHGGDFPDPSVLETVHDEPAMTVAEAPLELAISPPMTKAPEVRGARPPRAPLFGGVDPAEPLAWVLTVLLFLGGVVAAIHHPHPPSDITGVLASKSSASADPERRTTDEELLRSVQIEQADLPSGWTMTGSEVQADPDGPDDCLTQPAWGGVIAGRSRDFAYQLQASGRESGHVFDVVTTSATPERTAARLDVTRASNYPACWIKGFIASVHAAGPDEVIGTPSFEPLDVSLPAKGTAFQSVVHLRTYGGDSTLTIDNYHLAVGRVLAHIEFQRCSCEDAGTLSGPDLELPVLSAVARRLASVSGR